VCAAGFQTDVFKKKESACTEIFYLTALAFKKYLSREIISLTHLF
jgi:hypothetical protein